MDSSIGNLILTNLAFWVFVLYPVVPKLLLVLFLSWLELRSELGNNYIKGSKYGWIGFSMSNSVILWLNSSQKWTRLIWISNWTHLFCYLLFTIIYLFDSDYIANQIHLDWSRAESGFGNIFWPQGGLWNFQSRLT